MPSAVEIMDALAEQIEGVLCGVGTPRIEQLQVYGRMHFNPTPPAIDIYPADPFTEAIGFGSERGFRLTVRARVSTAESEGGQDLLLSMMDPAATTSVAEAIEGPGALDALVDDVSAGDPTGFGVFPAQGGETGGNLLGCTWIVTVLP